MNGGNKVLFAAAILFLMSGISAGLAAPAYTNPSDNASAYVSDHAVFEIRAKWTPTASQNLSMWTFSHNESGSWVNESWSSTFGSGNWTNYTMTTNSSWTDAQVVFFQIFANTAVEPVK